MSDALDRMRQAFESQPDTTPRKKARDSAINAALAAFDAEKSPAPQGILDGTRQRNRHTSWLNVFNGSFLMSFARLSHKHMLAGGASLAVLTLAVLSYDALRPDLIVPRDNEVRQTSIASLPIEEQAISADAVAAPADGAAPGAVARKSEKLTFAVESRARQAPAVSAPASGLVPVQPIMDPPAQSHYAGQGRDQFTEIDANPIKQVSESPVSTFSADVDTASYAFTRKALNSGVLPQRDAVRVEEMINYFDYDYAVPTDRSVPFNANITVMPSPWNSENKLLSIGIKGYEIPRAEAPPANLVFLIDTSGSMDAPDKLPLLRNAFRLLLSTMKPEDTVAIVAYAGSAGTVLEPTPVSDRQKILSALDQLHAGGSTAGGEGLRLAYGLAEQNLRSDGVNRVLLATDGDFNVGITDPRELSGFIERKRDTGISLSVLGFGRGNYNDALMQDLAQNGNGNAAYIDTLNEARKVLVEEAGSTLFTIAGDVKLQLEFNPATVGEYRLIGYETRLLNRQDFNNDKVDAGDIGAGHSVTALYEFTPAGSNGLAIDDLRYQQNESVEQGDLNDEYAFLKIRYKLPGQSDSELISVPITSDAETAPSSIQQNEARFAAAVAAFGQILRGGKYTGDFDYEDVIELAQSSKGDDPFGYRSEFINLVRLAESANALQPLKR